MPSVQVLTLMCDVERTLRDLEVIRAEGGWVRAGGAGAVWKVLHTQHETDLGMVRITLEPVDSHDVPLGVRPHKLPMPSS